MTEPHRAVRTLSRSFVRARPSRDGTRPKDRRVPSAMARVCRAALAFVAWAALAAHVASAFVLSQHNTPPPVLPGAVTLQPCDQHTSATQQQWLVDSDGLFKSAADPSLCLGATTQQGKLAAQSRTVTTPCRPAAADTQSWEYVNRRIISTANSSFCLMAAAGGVEATGAPVQLVDCSTSCVGGATQLCQWRFSEGGYIVRHGVGGGECKAAPGLGCVCVCVCVWLCVCVAVAVAVHVCMCVCVVWRRDSHVLTPLWSAVRAVLVA